ncbi:hypothetical protein VTI74DRAFT_9758 [Chaetomium olivicolor]
MAALFSTIIMAVCAAARGITEPPAMNTEVARAPEACSLINSIPGCGIPCLLDASGKEGCPNPFDFACQCKAADKIHARAAPCVSSSCNEQLRSTLESVAKAICTECAT